MAKPISFYFHCNLDPYSREAAMNSFNEFCILTNVLMNKANLEYRVYVNKPMKFLTFPRLNDWVDVIPIEKDDWLLGMTALKDAKPAYKPSHLSDFYRYFYIVRHGGVYMDTDVIVVNPYYDLLEAGWDLIFSKEKTRISGGTIICPKAESPCMQAVLQNYFDDYRPDAWTYNAMLYLTMMLEDNPGAERIKIMQREEGFYNPHCNDIDLLYTTDSDIKDRLKSCYAHHICGFLSTLPKSRKMRKHIMGLIAGKIDPKREEYLDNLVVCFLEEYKKLEVNS